MTFCEAYAGPGSEEDVEHFVEPALRPRVHKLGPRREHKREAALARHRARQQRLPRAWRPTEQDALPAHAQGPQERDT